MPRRAIIQLDIVPRLSDAGFKAQVDQSAAYAKSKLGTAIGAPTGKPAPGPAPPPPGRTGFMLGWERAGGPAAAIGTVAKYALAYRAIELASRAALAPIVLTKEALVGSVRAWMDYEEQMALTARTMRMAGMNQKLLMDVMGGDALNFLMRHRLTMEQVAQAQYELGSAGFNAAQALQMYTVPLKLAIGLQGDVTQTTRLMTQMLRIHGDQMGENMSDYEKMVRIGGILAKTWEVEQVELSDLAAAYKYVAGTARILNISAEELIPTIGFLSTMGARGSIGGTSLNQFLTQTARNVRITKDQIVELQKAFRGGEGGKHVIDLGIKPGQMDMVQIMVQIGRAMKDMELKPGGLWQIAKVLGDLNNIRGARAIALIVRDLERYLQTLGLTAGKTTAELQAFYERLVDIMQNTPTAQLEIMRNVLYGLGVNFVIAAAGGDTLTEALRNINGWLRSLVPAAVTAGNAIREAVAYAVGFNIGARGETMLRQRGVAGAAKKYLGWLPGYETLEPAIKTVTAPLDVPFMFGAGVETGEKFRNVQRYESYWTAKKTDVFTEYLQTGANAAALKKLQGRWKGITEESKRMFGGEKFGAPGTLEDYIGRKVKEEEDLKRRFAPRAEYTGTPKGGGGGGGAGRAAGPTADQIAGEFMRTWDVYEELGRITASRHLDLLTLLAKGGEDKWHNFTKTSQNQRDQASLQILRITGEQSRRFEDRLKQIPTPIDDAIKWLDEETSIAQKWAQARGQDWDTSQARLDSILNTRRTAALGIVGIRLFGPAAVAANAEKLRQFELAYRESYADEAAFRKAVADVRRKAAMDWLDEANYFAQMQQDFYDEYLTQYEQAQDWQADLAQKTRTTAAGMLPAGRGRTAAQIEAERMGINIEYDREKRRIEEMPLDMRESALKTLNEWYSVMNAESVARPWREAKDLIEQEWTDMFVEIFSALSTGEEKPFAAINSLIKSLQGQILKDYFSQWLSPIFNQLASEKIGYNPIDVSATTTAYSLNQLSLAGTQAAVALSQVAGMATGGATAAGVELPAIGQPVALSQVAGMATGGATAAGVGLPAIGQPGVNKPVTTTSFAQALRTGQYGGVLTQALRGYSLGALGGGIGGSMLGKDVESASNLAGIGAAVGSFFGPVGMIIGGLAGMFAAGPKKEEEKPAPTPPPEPYRSMYGMPAFEYESYLYRYYHADTARPFVAGQAEGTVTININGGDLNKVRQVVDKAIKENFGTGAQIAAGSRTVRV